MPDDPDQLLALALARVPSQPPRPVRTHKQILAGASRARARAAVTRQELRGTLERLAAVRAQTLRVHAQLRATRPALAAVSRPPRPPRLAGPS